MARASSLAPVRMGLLLVCGLLPAPPARGVAAEEPRHLLRYLEGLDALSEARWAEAAAIFDETIGVFGRDGRPWMARGAALTMQRQFAPAVAAFNEAGLRGYRGREPGLWRYVVERMTNGVVDPSHGISGPRSLGGQRWFSGIPGHMIQGREDYPTNYASFLYYNYAPPGGSDRMPMIADGRGNRQNSNFAHFAKGAELGEALLALARDAIRRRDAGAAQVYMEQAGQTALPDEQRRQLNEMNFELARIMQGGW